MNMKEILAEGSGVLLILLTLVQIAPVKVNPWSAIARTLGRVFNGSVIEKLDKLEEVQKETRERLEEHICMDNKRTADRHRVLILHFNRELLAGDVPHTREDFIEVLHEIDSYERYCREHPEYENNRAVLAIQNITRVYSEKLECHDFTQE